MSRGKRYSNEPKLNIKKVIAVILVIFAVVMFIIAIKKLIQDDNSSENIVATSYFTLYSNEKWGVIDNNGKTIIEPEYEEMIIIPNSNKDIFICTENTNYITNEYTTKVLNSKNKEILQKYENLLPLENYDEYNNLWYEDNVLKFIQNEKCGLIDFEGKIILEPNFENIYTLKGIEGAIITVKDNKLGLVDNNGNQLVPNNYTEIKSLGEDTDLYIVKNEESKYGIYNKLDTKYEEIKPLNNKDIYCVKRDGKYKVINSEEKEIFNLEFDDIKQIENNIIVYSKNKKYGAYEIEQKKNIKCQYNDLVYTCNNNFIAKVDKSYGIIDLDNKIKQKIEYASIDFYDSVQIYELTLKNNTESENIIINNNLDEIARGILDEVNAERSYIRIWT